MATASKRTQTGLGSEVDTDTVCVSLVDGKDNNSHTMMNANRSPTENNAVTGCNDICSDDKSSIYTCNICLDTAKNAVVSMCGHLFCWHCLYHWLQTGGKLCPVCKSVITKDKVIPIYGRNSLTQTEDNVPPRPTPKRLEPKKPWLISSFDFNYDFFIDLGFGRIPLGYLSPFVYVENPTDPQRNEEQKLSWMFLFLVFICFAWLILS